MKLSLPPYPSGGIQQQMLQQYTYLFQMAQQLNLALEQLEGGTAELQAVSETTSGSFGREQVRNLKSLIARTADTVNRRMDELFDTLAGHCMATADFERYVRQLSAYLETNPNALEQYYGFLAPLRAEWEGMKGALEYHENSARGYVCCGIVDYDGEVPVRGVAVGQHLSVAETDGEQVIEPIGFRAVFTAKRLSFRQDGTEVAFVEDGRFTVRSLNIAQTLTVGAWRIDTSDGLIFQWIGGTV